MSLISVRTDVVMDVLADPSAARSAGLGARAVATELARAGWLSRVVERERFPRAREPGPPLSGSALELARREPLERPEPAEETVTWLVPGPGGHVRHYLALRTLEARPGAAAAADELQLSAPAELKRCWVYGFALCALKPGEKG